MSSEPISTVHNILNSRVKTAERYREANGWRLPITTPYDVSFALKASRVPRRDDLRATIAALQAIGREGSWLDDAALAEVAQKTGSTMKHLGWMRGAINGWLASIDHYVARLGEVSEGGHLRRGGLTYTGGLTTTVILAGDELGLAPWVLAHALLANARLLVKPSSVEPLSAYLFAKAAVEKGLSVPALICLDTSAEEDVSAIIQLVERSDQSVLFGEDRTVEAVYRRASVRPPHKAIPFWSGRSGALVLPDADLSLAARGVIFGATMDRGNKCVSTKKVFAPRALMDRFEKELIAAADALKRGSALDPDVDIGGLDAWGRTAAERNAAAHAIIYDRDVILARVEDDRAPMLCEEVPYPSVAIRYYRDDEDPVEIANATVRGTPSGRALNMAVFTQDDARYQQIAEQLFAFKVLHNAPSTAIDFARTHQGMHIFLELMRQREICERAPG